MTYAPAVDGRPDPVFAADVVWFDSLVTNTDRSPRNPNLLVWHRRPWLIDHGAALFVHHTWKDPDAHARRPLPTVGDHVLLRFAGPLSEAHDRLAPRITRDLLEAVVGLVPDAWFELHPRLGGPPGQRAAYVDYLLARVAARDALVLPAEEARRAA
jgi:hypothetical protein